VEACGSALYISDHFCRKSGEHSDRQFEVHCRTGVDGILNTVRPADISPFFLFLHRQKLFGDEISWMHATNHSPSLSIFCRIFGEYLGRRFEVQNRRTRGGLCSVFQITITPRPLLVSKLFIHVQSLSGYETPCMGRRIPARPSSSNHFFAELPVVIGDERWPWLRLCRAAGGRERVCRRVVGLWRSKAK